MLPWRKFACAAPTTEAREKLILAAGNILGIGKVEEEITVSASEPEATFHTVEKGDTLWKGAEKAFGNGSKYPVIFEANKSMLSDPDKIYPGQVLRIPAL
ncbi:LysM peptidoglycan-binding domain-containing protein [Labrenzia aggregata]|uniref:LysM peptidoglycan-binding domain-containing protein n=2 Tax=Roseibium aggregatum TaxID=187304 RepID=A0A939EH53_9HYPH|nr:LysM peptidoglycan-binding domain-containing protein [Roseibium aggregatum]